MAFRGLLPIAEEMPSVGFRFADRAAGKLQHKQWYQTDLLELTPLTEPPAELKP